MATHHKRVVGGFLLGGTVLATAAFGLLAFARDQTPDVHAANAERQHAEPSQPPSPAPHHAAEPRRSPLSPADESAHRLLDLPPETLRSVDAEYKELRTVLHDSGVTHEGWADDARAVLAELSAVPVLADVRIEPAQCFAAGCIVDLTYAERSMATTLTEPTLSVLERWYGNHMLTGPRETAAGWTQAVILIRPETTEPRRN